MADLDRLAPLDSPHSLPPGRQAPAPSHRRRLAVALVALLAGIAGIPCAAQTAHAAKNAAPAAENAAPAAGSGAAPATAAATPPVHDGAAAAGTLPVAAVIALEAAGERFRDVALTPDGHRVAWVEALDGRDGLPSSHSAIFVADLAPTAGATAIAGAARPAGTADTAGTAGATKPAGTKATARTQTTAADQPLRNPIAAPAPSDAPGSDTVPGIGPRSAAPPRRITAGADAVVEGQLAWSPDGQRLAFVSDAGHAAGGAGGAGATARVHPRSAAAVADSRVNASRTDAMRARPATVPLATDVDEPRSQRQIWVADLATGRVARITDVSGQVSDLRWSPDGTAIAFLHIAGRDTAAGAVHAMPRDAGVVGETPQEQRLTIVDPATGALNAISPADLFIYEYDWSPDGASFAVTAAHGSGDDNWWIAELGVLARNGGAMHPLLRPRYQIAFPRWSPDGRSIAFIGGLMSDQGVTGGDVYLLAADPAAGQPAGPAGSQPTGQPANPDAGLATDQAAATRQARNLTPGRAASAASLAWTADAKLLVFEAIDGDSGLARIDPSTGDVAPLWRLGAAFADLSLSRDGSTAAAIVSSFDRAPEVWAGPVSSLVSSLAGSSGATASPAPATVADLGWRPLTRRNAGVRPAWGAARSLHWTSDGARVQGWLLSPPGAPPTSGVSGVSGAAGPRRPLLPMVVLVHGGPASSHRAGWPRLAGVLASQGFYVLLPNPRGSYGQGEDFTRGNVKDFGYGDLRDILAGVDAAVAAAPIDPARIGLDGWSYGGYMAMWAVTQTQRFRAAVAGAGIVDWQSYYGQNGIDQWMIPYFGASVYDDPWIYARSSPITFIKAVHTPTLILQGERDAEVPAPQAYQFWRALRTLGVETRLVIYPDQGHHLTRTDNRDMEQRTVDWLTTHLR